MYYLLAKQNSYNPANVDFYCIAPGIQQVVGLATLISNAGKVLNDLTAHIEAFALKYFQSEKKNAFDRQRLHVFSEMGVCEDDYVQSHISSLLLDTEINLSRHLLFMGIGLIRMTPTLGTVYSAWAYYSSNLIHGNHREKIDEKARSLIEEYNIFRSK